MRKRRAFGSSATVHRTEMRTARANAAAELNDARRLARGGRCQDALRAFARAAMDVGASIAHDTSKRAWEHGGAPLAAVSHAERVVFACFRKHGALHTFGHRRGRR